MPARETAGPPRDLPFESYDGGCVIERFGFNLVYEGQLLAVVGLFRGTRPKRNPAEISPATSSQAT
jgi:hypothetical protein